MFSYGTTANVRALFYLRGPVPPGAHLRWRDTDWRAQAWPLWAT